VNTGSELAKKDSCGKAAQKKDGGKKGTTPAVDPNVAASKAHGGKVWILGASPPNVEGEELVKWLSSHAPAAEVAKKANEERWAVNFLAVFKKPPAKGPLTIEFVDKKEPKTLVDQYSTQMPAGELVFQEPYDLDTNNGFNKGHTYIIKVGQIIKGKFVNYANGEVTLK
jgi:hypothetical protein